MRAATGQDWTGLDWAFASIDSSHLFTGSAARLPHPQAQAQTLTDARAGRAGMCRPGGPRRRRRPGMGRWWWCSQQLPALRDRWCRYFSVAADAGADFQLRIRSPSGGGGSSTQPAPRSQSGLRRRTFPSCEVPVCAAAEASIGLGMPVADGRRWVVEPGGEDADAAGGRRACRP